MDATNTTKDNEIKARIERFLETLDKSKPQSGLLETIARKFEITEEQAARYLDEIAQE